MPNNQFNVLVAGTFDGIHAGHLKLLEFARKSGLKQKKNNQTVKLWVIIAQDSNVLKIKGKLPVHNQNERKLIAQSIKLVDEAIIGMKFDFFKTVEKIKPDLIVLGYDQSKTIENILKEKGYKAIRASAYKKNKIKTRILKENKFQNNL